ncbi:hypothetical protein K493DRAFT_295670 [Basidiobolus meristosporus CBS 931.73]|uniref:Uncharacterized protein n=1 Tax=Basidiobolus meristosporus CBS 931.73 TaxID=1314790 RepID=A0A1Y1ZAA7_9FUNG|nr:hypothetical protein K493DRAFT_295670 [Basidiobolus meristosporus CBS 931.73]|eukprot:ORY07096.1 hypothetical protein K493DRAFT_295670 [Basidiobolus meristosporus CBS 931.73]
MHPNQTLTKYGYIVNGTSKEMIFYMSIIDKHQVANEKRLMKEIKKDPRVPNNLTVLDHSTASAVRYEIQQRHRNKIRLTHKPSIIDNQLTKIKRKISFEKLLAPPSSPSRKLKFDNIDIIFPYDPEAPSSIVPDPAKIGLTTIPPKSALKSPSLSKTQPGPMLKYISIFHMSLIDKSRYLLGSTLLEYSTVFTNYLTFEGIFSFLQRYTDDITCQLDLPLETHCWDLSRTQPTQLNYMPDYL